MTRGIYIDANQPFEAGKVGPRFSVVTRRTWPLFDQMLAAVGGPLSTPSAAEGGVVGQRLQRATGQPILGSS